MAIVVGVFFVFEFEQKSNKRCARPRSHGASSFIRHSHILDVSLPWWLWRPISGGLVCL